MCYSFVSLLIVFMIVFVYMITSFWGKYNALNRYTVVEETDIVSEPIFNICSLMYRFEKHGCQIAKS